MRPVVITQTGAGQSAPVPLDRYLTPFSVTIGCVVTGTVSYKLQYTYDDVFNPPVAGITWHDDTDIPAATTENAESSFNNTISAVRINQASGSGSVTATINQAGAR